MLPFARYTHRSLLQAAAYLATLPPSLSSYLIPTGFLTITVCSRLGLPSECYRTIRLLQLQGNVRLLLSYTSYNFLPPAVPSPACLSFPSLTTTSLRYTLFDSSVITRIRIVRVGLPPLFSLCHSFRYFSCGRERRRSFDTQREQDELIGDFDRTLPLTP